MKLHQPISTGLPDHQYRRYNYGTPSPFSLAGISMQVQWGCIDACVGTANAARCGNCGTDIDCWRRCAGTDGVCISNCIRGDTMQL